MTLRLLVTIIVLGFLQFSPLKAQDWDYKPPYEELDIRDLFKHMAIKTNLLAFPATSINIGVEKYVGDRYSVAAQVYIPRWHNEKNQSWCADANLLDIEARYWFRDWKLKPWRKPTPAPLTGHFAGIYAMGGIVDLAAKGKGNQANVMNFGVTYGYSMPLTYNFHLELSVSCGYISANYDRYHVSEDGQEVYKRYSGRTSWIGPTKGSISLVWLFGKRRKEVDE